MTIVSDQTLGNSAAVLWRIVRDIEKIEADIKTSNEDVKTFRTELKARNLPVKGMSKIISDARKDQEKLEEARKDLALAGAVLGVQVFTRSDKPVSIKQFDPDVIELAKQRRTQIDNLLKDIDEGKDEIKDLKKEAKDLGFPLPVLNQVLRIRKNPEKYHEESPLIDVFLKAIEDAAKNAGDEAAD